MPRPASGALWCAVVLALGAVRAPVAAARPETAPVAISDPDNENVETWRFEPVELTVARGTTVVWRNAGEYEHTVTSAKRDGQDAGEAFSSPNLAPGERFAHKFSARGEYRYFCSPHPWMKAVIRVR